MKAVITKTVDGYKVWVEAYSDNISKYISNLGGKKTEDGFFLWARDAGPSGAWVKDLLADEGYTIEAKEQI